MLIFTILGTHDMSHDSTQLKNGTSPPGKDTKNDVPILPNNLLDQASSSPGSF